jgi:hypothetical protein
MTLVRLAALGRLVAGARHVLDQPAHVARGAAHAPAGGREKRRQPQQPHQAEGQRRLLKAGEGVEHPRRLAALERHRADGPADRVGGHVRHLHVEMSISAPGGNVAKRASMASTAPA